MFIVVASRKRNDDTYFLVCHDERKNEVLIVELARNYWEAVDFNPSEYSLHIM